jgi:hypothetical protein
MIDPFGTVLSWIIILGAFAYIIFHVLKVVRSERLEIRNAAAIMFGTGWLIIELPRRVYPTLPSNAFDALNWFGIVTVLSSIALEMWGRRINRERGAGRRIT